MLLTIPETCEMLKLGRTRLYSLISQGDITARKIGKKTLIEKTELERWVASLPAYKAQKHHE